MSMIKLAVLLKTPNAPYTPLSRNFTTVVCRRHGWVVVVECQSQVIATDSASLGSPWALSVQLLDRFRTPNTYLSNQINFRPNKTLKIKLRIQVSIFLCVCALTFNLFRRFIVFKNLIDTHLCALSLASLWWPAIIIAVVIINASPTLLQ